VVFLGFAPESTRCSGAANTYVYEETAAQLKSRKDGKVEYLTYGNPTRQQTKG